MFFSEDRNVWLWVIPLILIFRYGGYLLKTKRLSCFISPKLWKEMIPSLSGSRRLLKVVWVVLGLTFVILAYMRPQFGQVEQLTVHEGSYVVVALDTSKSMLAEDLGPNRLEYAKREIRSFIDQSEGDRIGVVVFSGNAFVHCPFTTDYEALKLFVDDIRVGMIPRQGTNLAAAIRKSRDMIGSKRYDNGAIVIFSDGEYFEGNPIRSAEVSGEIGVPIYVVGLGADEGRPIPLKNEMGVRIGFKKDREGAVVLSRLNRQKLESVASVSKGKSFFVSDNQIVSDRLYQSISNLEGKRLKEERSVRKAERFQWFLVVGFFFLLLDLGFSGAKKYTMFWFFALSSFFPIHADLRLSDYLKFQEGNRYMEVGSSDLALSQYASLKSQGVLDVSLFYNLGMAFYEQGDYEQSEQLFLDVLKKQPLLKKDVMLQLGNIMYKRGDYQKAIDHYQSLVSEFSGWREPLHNLELALQKLKDLKGDKHENDTENDSLDSSQTNSDSGASDSKDDQSGSKSRSEDQTVEANDSNEKVESDAGSGSETSNDEVASDQVVQQFLSTLDQQEAASRKAYQQRFKKGGGQVSHDW